MMTTVRDVITRDIGLEIEGVVKVFDEKTLRIDIREYVVTDKIEQELERVFGTFTQVSETLRRGGPARDVMGIWVSGFFGSGKSHFAKVLGHLLQNTPLGGDPTERCIDAFTNHLSDTPRGLNLRLRLGELKLNTEISAVFFEIRSRQSLTNPNSVGEILLSEFYRSIGLAENFVVARIERKLQRRALLGRLEQTYEEQFGVPWRSLDGRDDLRTVRRRLSQVLPLIDPTEHPDERTARDALADIFRHERITAEGIADELVAWVESRKTTGGKAAHLVFVVDEMGTFIGDSNDRISELNSLAEMIGNKGKGKVWLIATSQQDLEKVVDRTNFQPALVGRLNARFELKPQLISDEITKVVSERILKKHPAQEAVLRNLYKAHEGYIGQLADLKASRHLGTLNERGFIDAYPFLSHQIRLAQDIFEALSGFRISGGVRSMISVVMETLHEIADKEVGVLVSFDQVFDAVENDLLSQEYLGAPGVRSIHDSDDRVPGTRVAPARVLKVLWLIQQVTWVPRVPEAIAKLLVRDFATDLPTLRDDVGETLLALQQAGYTARDEATGEWKYLNERERTIEQAIQEMMRASGPRSISLAAVRRTSQEMCKTDLITKRKLGNFSVPYGVTKLPFPYGVWLDGEALDTGPELAVRFTSPLAPGRSQEIEDIRQQNQAAGPKGRTIWWVAAAPDAFEKRLKRYEALVKVTSDKRFVDDVSKDTQDALTEKRKERDDLRIAILRDLERSFLGGALFYGGQEVEIEGETDFRSPLTKAVTSLIRNVFPRFAIADRPFDFAKQLKAFLNPATSKLDGVAPELGLFDTQGSLQREAAVVAPVLEVLRDIEDGGGEPVGANLLDTKEQKGFRGFCRAPFGWPEELIRLILAACFRSGAIYLERQSGAGPSAMYDYRGSDDLFAKINTFRRVTFRIAETSLSIDQLKDASKALIELGVSGVPESGNAIAQAVRELGARLKSELDEAVLRAQGIPLPDDVLSAAAALTEPATAKDPSTAVRAFLNSHGQWNVLALGLRRVRTFIEANRHKEYETSRRLEQTIKTHPIPEWHSNAHDLEKACEDLAAIIEEKEVVERWSDYRGAYDSMFAIYRDVYISTYDRVRAEAEAALVAIKGSKAYLEAPPDQRDVVVAKVFGPGKACDYPAIALPSVGSLLEAAGRRSLGWLEQATLALPAYTAQVEAELHRHNGPPGFSEEKVYEWRPLKLIGRRFKLAAEVDEVLQAIGDEMKMRIRDGFTVVVK
jgi:Family of unknown function (DUF6079)